MTLVEKISLGLKVVTSCFAIYFIIFPQKLKQKQGNLSPLKIRLIFGVVLFLLVASTATSFLARSQSQLPENLSAEQTAKINEVESKIENKLAAYSDQAKSHKFTLLCKEENKKNIVLQTPNMPDKTADLIALSVCTCMYDKLKALPEFSKVESLLASGKHFIEVMNESFQNADQIMPIAQTCSDL